MPVITLKNILFRNKKLLIINLCLLFLLTLLYSFFSAPPSKVKLREYELLLPNNSQGSYPPPKKTESDKSKSKWKHYTVSHHETLSEIFNKLNLPSNALYQVLKQLKQDEFLHNLKNGQKISIEMKDGLIDTLILEYKDKKIAISKTNNHYIVKDLPISDETIEAYVTVTISNSIIQDAKSKGLPYKYVLKLAKIFASNVDFSRDIRQGDRFTIVYQRYINSEGKPTQFGPILAASFTNRGHTFYAFLFNNDKTNQGYFDPAGKSLQQSFDRYPFKPNRISSKFSLHRIHPVLKKTIRPHKGVDLAAKTNTPIHAVSDGIILKVGETPGYGKMVQIRHNMHDDTLYAHMNKISKGLTRYKKVKRGDIIGYVGQTGLANGPHCHFEFHKNGKAVNPSSIKLPMSQSINSRYVFQFNDLKEKYMGQLKLLEAAALLKKVT